MIKEGEIQGWVEQYTKNQKYEENLTCSNRDISNQKDLTQNFYIKVDERREAQMNKQTDSMTLAECYNVLSPFFGKLRKWGSKFATLNLVWKSRVNKIIAPKIMQWVKTC